MKFEVIAITEHHIEGFWAAVDTVAREREYLAFLEAPPLAATRAFVQGNIRDGQPHYVAIHETTVIGWCDICSLNRPVFRHSGVLGMGVLPEFRGHGIGKALIMTALEKAKAIGLTRVELDVREQNHRAIALYEHVGFIIEGLKRNATRIDGHYSNDLCMAILFPDSE